jgi:hypothetical protein
MKEIKVSDGIFRTWKKSKSLVVFDNELQVGEVNHPNHVNIDAPYHCNKNKTKI